MTTCTLAGQPADAFHAMVDELSGCAEVRAIVAEFADGRHALHVTTLTEPYDDAVLDRIYTAELKLLDRFQDVTFDFHTQPLEIVDGQPAIPSASCAQAIWYRQSCPNTGAS